MATSFMSRPSRIYLTLVCGFLLVGPSAHAQALLDPGIHTASPGARANGMGGAFIAVADDATASIANPAGIANLTRLQVYAEFTSTAPDEGGNTPRTNSLSFLSASTPIGERAAIAFTRNE